MCAPEDNRSTSDAELLQSWRSPGGANVCFTSGFGSTWRCGSHDGTNPGIGAGLSQAPPLTPCLLLSQEQPCLMDNSLALWVRRVKHQRPTVLPLTGSPDLDCPAGSPSPSIPVPGPKTPAPPASALSCVWRQKLTSRHRAPRWLPRSCLQVARIRQSGVELCFGPCRGLWGQLFPKVGVTPGRAREEGPRASPPCA